MNMGISFTPINRTSFQGKLPVSVGLAAPLCLNMASLVRLSLLML